MFLRFFREVAKLDESEAKARISGLPIANKTADEIRASFVPGYRPIGSVANLYRQEYRSVALSDSPETAETKMWPRTLRLVQLVHTPAGRMKGQQTLLPALGSQIGYPASSPLASLDAMVHPSAAPLLADMVPIPSQGGGGGDARVGTISSADAHGAAAAAAAAATVASLDPWQRVCMQGIADNRARAGASAAGALCGVVSRIPIKSHAVRVHKTIVRPPPFRTPQTQWPSHIKIEPGAPRPLPSGATIFGAYRSVSERSVVPNSLGLSGSIVNELPGGPCLSPDSQARTVPFALHADSILVHFYVQLKGRLGQLCVVDSEIITRGALRRHMDYEGNVTLLGRPNPLHPELPAALDTYMHFCPSSLHTVHAPVRGSRSRDHSKRGGLTREPEDGVFHRYLSPAGLKLATRTEIADDAIPIVLDQSAMRYFAFLSNGIKVSGHDVPWQSHLILRETMLVDYQPRNIGGAGASLAASNNAPTRFLVASPLTALSMELASYNGVVCFVRGSTKATMRMARGAAVTSDAEESESNSDANEAILRAGVPLPSVFVPHQLPRAGRQSQSERARDSVPLPLGLPHGEAEQTASVTVDDAWGQPIPDIMDKPQEHVALGHVWDLFSDIGTGAPVDNIQADSLDRPPSFLFDSSQQDDAIADGIEPLWGADEKEWAVIAASDNIHYRPVDHNKEYQTGDGAVAWDGDLAMTREYFADVSSGYRRTRIDDVVFRRLARNCEKARTQVWISSSRPRIDFTPLIDEHADCFVAKLIPGTAAEPASRKSLMRLVYGIIGCELTTRSDEDTIVGTCLFGELENPLFEYVTRSRISVAAATDATVRSRVYAAVATAAAPLALAWLLGALGVEWTISNPLALAKCMGGEQCPVYASGIIVVSYVDHAAQGRPAQHADCARFAFFPASQLVSDALSIQRELKVECEGGHPPRHAACFIVLSKGSDATLLSSNVLSMLAELFGQQRQWNRSWLHHAVEWRILLKSAMVNIMDSPILDTTRTVDIVYKRHILKRGALSCAAEVKIPATVTCLVGGCTNITAIADSGVCELHTGGQRGSIELCQRVRCLHCTGCGELCQAHGIATYGVFVKESGIADADLGLFAAVPFAAGDVILMINGILCSARDAELRWGERLCANGHCILKSAFAKQIYGAEVEIGDDAADEDWAPSGEDEDEDDGPWMEVAGESAAARAPAGGASRFAEPVDREGTQGNSRGGSKRSAAPPVSAAQLRRRRRLARTQRRAQRIKARAKAEVDARTYCYIDTYGTRSFARFANDPTRCTLCVDEKERCEGCSGAPFGTRPRVNASVTTTESQFHRPDLGPDHTCAMLVATSHIAAGAEIFIAYATSAV
jgi:hypothetical protein